MSKPEIKATLYNTMMEAGSATSSLHCPPDPIPIKDQGPEAMFLDEMDGMVIHASEHAQAASRSASKILGEMQQMLDKLHWQEWKQKDVMTTKEIRDQLRKWIGYH